jgi:hypothetical protein
MRQGLVLGRDQQALLHVTWPFWHARTLRLEGCPQDAIEVLGEIQRSADAREADDPWLLYVEVEGAHARGEAGEPDRGLDRLVRIGAAVEESRDPMLRWDFHRVRALLAERLERGHDAMASWQAALQIVRPHGLLRLQAEFALSFGEAALQCGEIPLVEVAHEAVEEVFDSLRAAEGLARRRRRLAEALGR